MDFELSEENKLIKDTARRIARDVVAPRAKELVNRHSSVPPSLQ